MQVLWQFLTSVEYCIVYHIEIGQRVKKTKGMELLPAIVYSISKKQGFRSLKLINTYIEQLLYDKLVGVDYNTFDMGWVSDNLT